ncbi:MAG TPA: Hsp70 family protein [Candidatus Limnocylindria bacterium]|nr:Hsp70 family protein [Candidatus Limnocylindria bacterium]
MLRFGLDFGTSNSALAVRDDGRARLLPLDSVAGTVMPTTLYVRRDGLALVGQAAVDSYFADSAARGPIRRKFKLLDVHVPSTDPQQPMVRAHILTDLDAPGRLFQSLKSFLGDPLVGRTNVFGEARGLEELIAAILSHVRERAFELTGERPRAITLGRPVRFVGEDDGVEHRAVERLRAAAHLAGFRRVRFGLEPVAAAFAANVPTGNTLVFDFGGGTLDVCVARRAGADIRVLATAGADVGGDRFTELLIEEHVSPRLGGGQLPAFIANAIHDWHALSALNEKDILDALDDFSRAGGPRRELAALVSAIELQLGYEIFRTIDDAKIRLSDFPATILTYHRAKVDIDAKASRFRFEQLIGPSLRRIDALLEESLALASVSSDLIDEVVTTGGSSKIPAVRALLRRRFPRATLREADPFGAVAAGLALLES